MPTLDEIKSLAMNLTDSERAQVASKLLCSLPPCHEAQDDADAEALLRDEEMDNYPSAGLTLEEFKRAVGR